MRKWNPIVLIIIVLAFVGMIVRPNMLVIPIIVFGIIFLLYKFPPARMKQRSSMPRGFKPSAAQTMKPKPKSPRKNIPFRVIEGGKDDDDIPKYH